MICRKCQKLIPDGSQYCNHCGSKQTIERSHGKRPNGSGSVRKVGSKYECRVTVFDPDRRTLSRRYDKKSEALAAGPQLRAELAGLAGKTRDTATVGSLYQIWLEASAPKLSDSKQTAYRIAWSRIKKYERTPITALDLGDLQRLVADLTYYPARDVKTLLSHIYKRACAQQDVPTNLAQYIELPKLIEEEPVPFSEAEVAAMWAFWNDGDPFVGYLLLMIYTGMMPGELMQCQTAMVDLDAQKITGAGLKTKERKTKPIVIPTIIKPVVAKICQEHPEKLVDIKHNNWYEAYHQCTARIGIRDLPPYACRHTTASMLATNEKIAPALITKAMRQTRPMTTERYKHADDNQVLGALNKIKISKSITHSLHTLEKANP